MGKVSASEATIQVASPERQDVTRARVTGTPDARVTPDAHSGQPADIPDAPIARWLDRWLLPIYLVFFLLIYSPSILLPYGYADDYAVLAAFEQGGSAARDILLSMIVGGRPVYALMTDLFYSHAQSMSDLQVMRCVGVITIGAVAWLFYQVFRKAGAGLTLATVAPVLICVTPPFQLAASWTALSFFPLAALFAGVAVLLVDRISPGAWIRAAGCFVGALVLETLAMTLYQPEAMLFWVFAAILLVMRVSSPRAFLRRAARFTLVGVIASSIDFLVIKLLPHLGVHNFGTARTALSTNLKTKLVWFALHPFASALNVWSLRPSLALGAGVAVFAALGVVCYISGASGAWQVKVLKLATLVALIPLTYLPNLAVADMSGPFRTQVALMSLVVLCLCLACVGYVRIVRQYLSAARSRRLFQRGIVVAGLITTLALSALACDNVTQDIAIPEYTESAMIQSQLRAIDLSSTQAIYVRMSCLSDSAAPIARFDEIGLPSTSILWATQPMLAVELQEINPADAAIPIIVEAPEARFTVPAGSSEVNARLLRLYRAHQPWTYGPLLPC